METDSHTLARLLAFAAFSIIFTLLRFLEADLLSSGVLATIGYFAAVNYWKVRFNSTPDKKPLPKQQETVTESKDLPQQPRKPLRIFFIRRTTFHY